jgi:hypothetical protein
MSTATILKKMLQENTGRHMLDSGGAYGRNWEKNQKRAFDKEPASIYRIDQHNIEVTHNVYHWLREHVDYSVDWTKRFNKFAAKPEHKEEGWMQLMELFADQYSKEGDEYRCTVNTYNGEDLLSQVLQYTQFVYGSECIYLIQIHGGCDVRGGYTKPRAFYGEDYALMDNARASFFCQSREDKNQLQILDTRREQHYWNTDDAYHFYYQGTCGYGAGTQLEHYERKAIESQEEWESGLLCYFEDGKALCPKCGGKLEIGY